MLAHVGAILGHVGAMWGSKLAPRTNPNLVLASVGGGGMHFEKSPGYSFICLYLLLAVSE